MQYMPRDSWSTFLFVNSHQNLQIPGVGLPFSNLTFISNFSFRPVVGSFFVSSSSSWCCCCVGDFGKRDCACGYLSLGTVGWLVFGWLVDAIWGFLVMLLPACLGTYV